MAEGYFRHQLATYANPVTIQSAGLNAVVGYPAEPTAQIVMRKNGIDISQHRAQQISDVHIRKADLIFVMTKIQLTQIVRQFLTVKGKTFLLGHWSGFEIEDPVMLPQEFFEKIYQQIEIAWLDWKKRI